jgi:hypothetical protein
MRTFFVLVDAGRDSSTMAVLVLVQCIQHWVSGCVPGAGVCCCCCCCCEGVCSKKDPAPTAAAVVLSLLSVRMGVGALRRNGLLMAGEGSSAAHRLYGYATEWVGVVLLERRFGS